MSLVSSSTDVSYELCAANDCNRETLVDQLIQAIFQLQQMADELREANEDKERACMRQREETQRAASAERDEGRKVIVLQAALFMRSDPYKVQRPARK